MIFSFKRVEAVETSPKPFCEALTSQTRGTDRLYLYQSRLSPHKPGITYAWLKGIKVFFLSLSLSKKKNPFLKGKTDIAHLINLLLLQFQLWINFKILLRLMFSLLCGGNNELRSILVIIWKVSDDNGEAEEW